MNFNFEDCIILKFLAGSHSHGTATIDSDVDYRGIVIPPKSFFFGLDKFEQYETKEPDAVYYNIQKFVRLAIAGNPTILEYLYADEYLIKTSYAERLINIRHSFLGKHCAKPFFGYAQQQLHRLSTMPAPNGRTERRMALIEKFGYDTKYASHLVRILKMGIELLKEEVVKVKRPDATFLLDIKNGKYKLEEIKAMVEDLMQQFKQAEQTTQLPDCSNYNEINNVLIEIVEDYFNKKKEEETRQ